MLSAQPRTEPGFAFFTARSVLLNNQARQEQEALSQPDAICFVASRPKRAKHSRLVASAWPSDVQAGIIAARDLHD